MGVCLSIVDLDLSVHECRSALKVPDEMRDIKWAAGRCISTRFVHKNVWNFRPSNEYVKEIMPLFEKSKEAVIRMCYNGFGNDEKTRLVIYARNITLRALNLEENYLCDKPSDFAPDSKIQEVEDAITARLESRER